MYLHPVALIAFKQSNNLGIGYLASVLSKAGYETQVIEFQQRKGEILKTLKRLNPLIVGFSLIFQYHIYEFQKLISYLRKGGIKCHFTAGGYYASLRYKDLFELIPSLDSVVRFEGEHTLLDLVNCINSEDDWQKVRGIAFKINDKIIATPLRLLETDLDKFPLPFRPSLINYAFDKKFTTIIAGRGCVNNCSFCNTREYYRQSSGPYKRLRKPEKVAWEMGLLYNKNDCSVFLFEDDDFPVKTENGSEWIERFCKELKRKKLNDKIMWKINCRPDEIDYDSFALMKTHGLYFAFLGLDDGTDSGLSRLNKNMTIAKSMQGINILKELEIGFDYGFMLFQPTSTFKSVNDNLDFLRKICGDGYAPVTFLKLRPYFETRIEKVLRKEERLIGNPGFLDYEFLDKSLNHYYEFVTDCLMEWFRDSDGLLNILRCTKNYFSVYSNYFEITQEVTAISGDIRKIISNSNLFLLDTLKELAILFESGKYNSLKYNDLNSYKKNIKAKHKHYKGKINNSLNDLFRLVEYQKLYQLSRS